MTAIELFNQKVATVQFFDEEDQSSSSEDEINDNTHSIFVKLSVATKDSHADDSQEDSAEEIEQSIMSWFTIKGVANGNPEDVI